MELIHFPEGVDALHRWGAQIKVWVVSWFSHVEQFSWQPGQAVKAKGSVIGLLRLKQEDERTSWTLFHRSLTENQRWKITAMSSVNPSVTACVLCTKHRSCTLQPATRCASLQASSFSLLFWFQKDQKTQDWFTSISLSSSNPTIFVMTCIFTNLSVWCRFQNLRTFFWLWRPI